MTEAMELQIRPGMSEATDARMLPLSPASSGAQATPRLLQNVRVRQQQRFEKRPGVASLGTTGLPTTGEACWVGEAAGSAVIGIAETAETTFNDNSIYFHNGGSRWSYMGRHGHCVPLRRFTVAGGQETAETTDPSVIAVSGLLYVCFADEGGASTIITIVEMTPEGTQLRSVQLTGEGSPRIIYTGAVFFLVTNDSGAIKHRVLNLTTFTLGSPTTLSVAATSGSTAIDVCVFESSNNWGICYAKSATELQVMRLDSGGNETADDVITTTSAPGLYAIKGESSNQVFVVYRDGTAAQMTVYTTSGLTSPNEYTLATASGNEAFTHQFSLIRLDTTPRYQVLLGGTDTDAGAPALTTFFTYSIVVSALGSISWGPAKTWHFVPSAKPIRVGSDGDATVYAWCGNGGGAWDDALQARHLLVKFEESANSGSQLASVSLEHQAYSLNTGFIGDVANLGDGRYAAMLPWRDPGKFAGVDCAVFTLGTPTSSMSQAHRLTEQAGGALFVSGGCLSDISDTQLNQSYMAAENGFAHAPLVKLELDTGGSLTADQEYTYVAVFRRIDGRGRVQRSTAPSILSDPVTITPTGSTLKVNVYVTTLGVSNRWGQVGESVVAEIYRSWNGGPFYYVAATGTVRPTANAVLYADTNSDDDVIDDDGAIDIVAAQPEPPSGARLIKEWGPRLAAVGWRENVAQLSKYYRADSSWEFVDSPQFHVEVPDPITALGWLDGAGVIFTARKIYLVAGDSPDDDGRSGAFSEPRETPATVGADSPHVVEVPQGLMFKGAGTIWLLPRGFGPPAPVGDDIQETLASFPYLRGAYRCSNADDDTTHFVLAASDLPAAETKVAVWDNRLSAWSLDDIAGEVGAAGAVGGVFTWLLPTWDAAADLPVREFSTAQFQDYSGNGASAWIETRCTLGDLRLFGAVGWGHLEKIQMVGEVVGDFTLSLTVTTDQNSPYTRTKVLTTEGQFYMEHGIEYPVGCAHSFSIFDAEASGKTAGMVLHALALEVKKVSGLRRVAADEAQRF